MADGIQVPGSELLEVGLGEVQAAQARITGIAWRTPTLPMSRNDDEVQVKLECLQRTGSFKIRGAWNRMTQTSGEERKAGFVTVSAGNHGQAVAWAARRLGAPCTVWVPEDAVERKVEAMQALGATIKRLPHDQIMQTMVTQGFPRVENQTYIHPFGHPDTIAGQGTVALEILEDTPDVKTILVPVGGGGLSAGIATAVKAKAPQVTVLGVQSAGAPALPKSLEHDRPEITGKPDTIADGVATDRVFPYMWPILRERLDGALVATDDQIKQAMRHMAHEMHVIAEGAGAVALAVALAHRDQLEAPIVAVSSGGNVDPALLRELLA